MRELGRTRAAEDGAAIASVAFLVAAIALVRPSEALAGAVLVAAIALVSAPVVLDALVSRRRPDLPTADTAPGGRAGVTTIVRLGGEPIELARVCIVLAARRPTVVVTATRTDLDDELAALGVPVFRCPTVEAAVHEAAQAITTAAVHVVSAGTMPLTPACEAAASRLTERCAWVVGRVRPFDADAYAPDSRETLGARWRTAARRVGLDLWERDAMLVRTDVLRAHPIEAGRPWGRWLRSMRAAGYESADDPSEFALRGAPAGAAVFWPATVTRQRALAADLADATTRGPARARFLALALLLRELYGFALATWLLAPLVVGLAGGFPFRWSPTLFAVVLGATGVARWLAVRWTYRVRPRPVTDLVAAGYDAPGSIAALAPALTRRVTPIPVVLPHRPLVWAALLLMVVLAVTLVTDAAGGFGADGNDVELSSGLAVVNLALLWLLLVRALAQWRWNRRVLRLPLALPVTIDGRPATTVDLSPSGAAVAGDLGDVATGSTVSIAVTFPDGPPPLRSRAVVVDRRSVGGRTILGLSMQLEPASSVTWIRRIVAVLGLDDPGVTLPRARRASTVEYRSLGRAGRVATVLDRVAIALAAVLSVVVLAVLVLVVAGYRPLVVRSDSMVPTLHTGDLVVVEEVTAGETRVGDVVTFEEPSLSDDPVTHRVRSIRAEDGTLMFETRGDANRTSEEWTRQPEDAIGRYGFRVPAVGSVMLALDEDAAQVLFIGLAVLLVLVVVGRAAVAARAARSSPPPALPSHGM